MAITAVGLAALLASGWITRERQLSTDLAESREDLRQAMHRLQTLSASTDQIRTAYLQRRTELEAAKKKIDQLAQRQEEKKRDFPLPKDGKRLEPKAQSPADAAALFEKIKTLSLPPWAAVQKSDVAVRLLPGASTPPGNEGYAAFGALARTLAEADPAMAMELLARAEPGPDALATAQDRAKRLSAAAERSIKKEAGRIRIIAEVARGPRMEWRLVPAGPAPKAQPAQP
jgi:cell division protein FtsB